MLTEKPAASINRIWDITGVFLFCFVVWEKLTFFSSFFFLKCHLDEEEVAVEEGDLEVEISVGAEDGEDSEVVVVADCSS